MSELLKKDYTIATRYWSDIGTEITLVNSINNLIRVFKDGNSIIMTHHYDHLCDDYDENVYCVDGFNFMIDDRFRFIDDLIEKITGVGKIDFTKDDSKFFERTVIKMTIENSN